MESIIRFFFFQWQRKLLALIIAGAIWMYVSHSITTTKTISPVPVRVINLPTDKTIQGLLPNGILGKRISLTLTGTKDVVDQLEPGDIEVVVDVTHLSQEGVVHLTKKNLVSLNPNVNLLRHVTSVEHPELVIKTSLLMTEQIPVTIQKPIGSPPEGYEYLDMWPIKLTQKVSGPQELILNLKNKGLEITFNLNEITKAELDAIKMPVDDQYDDEISFPVPDQWKKVVVPLVVNMVEPLNDSEAKHLQIHFLRKEYIPLKEELPINIFYPLKTSTTLNPATNAVEENSFVQYDNHIPVLKLPLFAYNVSKLFLDVVKGSLQIDIVAVPRNERETLEWGIDLVNYPHLEDTFVAFLLHSTKTSVGPRSSEREEHFRQRFNNYMKNFTLYLSSRHPLEIDSTIQDKKIIINVPHAATTSAIQTPPLSHAR